MLRIGHFSRITGVPVRTLLNRILALKDSGISLEQIAQILEDNLADTELQRLLCQAQTNLENQIETLQLKLTRIEKRLKHLETEDTMKTYDIVIKSVPQLRVIVRRVSSDQAFEPLFNSVFEQVTAFAADHNLKATGPMMAIFYEDPEDPNCDCDFAVAFPTDSHSVADEFIEADTLPAVDKMASCIFPDAYSADEVDEVYKSVIAWIEANNYRIDGPYREIFHPFISEQNVPEPVIEIQFPIKLLAQ